MTRSYARVAVIAAAFVLGLVLTSGGLTRWIAALSAAALVALVVLAERALREQPPRVILGGALGLVTGLLAALLAVAALGPAFRGAGVPVGLASALLALAGAYLGAALGARQLLTPELTEVTEGAEAPDAGRLGDSPSPSKIIDTSVIIDGRIADVIASGFLEGTLIVPQFILQELQKVADSSDSLKRARGRKGLDVLRMIRESERIRVELTDRDFPQIREVDAKILSLAEELGAKVLTNDYNLNKVAQLRRVPVLNVNDLANAVKPVVLPGETLTIQVIKEGKERNQGVGYLDDGTMVVVDNGKRLLGERVEVMVTSVIQTNAGKMIFTSAQDEETPERPRVARRDGQGNSSSATS